jgi:hypothetical protein
MFVTGDISVVVLVYMFVLNVGRDIVDCVWQEYVMVVENLFVRVVQGSVMIVKNYFVRIVCEQVV